MREPRPFIVEDYKPLSGELYQYTLRDAKTGESIAPLTVKQGCDMKLLLQCFDLTINKPAGH